MTTIQTTTQIYITTSLLGMTFEKRSKGVFRPNQDSFTFIEEVSSGLAEEIGVSGENQLPKAKKKLTNFFHKDLPKWDSTQDGERHRHCL